MKALIIDDEPDIQEVVSLCLSFRWPEMTIVTAADGRSGLDLVQSEQPHIVILDLGLPDVDGFEVCRRIREHSRVPIFILSVRGRDADIIRGLELGADDYVIKPFSQMQFLARVQALLRRTWPEAAGQVFQDGDLEVDLARYEVKIKGQPVKLTATEFAILSSLLRDAGNLVPHQRLLDNVWGPHQDGKSGYLKTHIKHIRRKLGDDAANPRRIVNQRGIGYRFVRSTA